MVAVVAFENEPRRPVLDVLERDLLPLVVYRNSLATPNHVRILFLEYGGRQEAGAVHSVRPFRWPSSSKSAAYRDLQYPNVAASLNCIAMSDMF
jgi:hypothetical protein